MKNQSIKKLLSKSFLKILLFSLSIMIVLTGYLSYESIKENHSLEFNQELNQKIQIDKEINNTFFIKASFISSSDTLRSINSTNDSKVIGKFLKNILGKSQEDGIYNVYATNKKLELIDALVGETGETYTLPDLTERSWYKGALEADGKIFISEPYEDFVTGKLLVALSIAIKDSDGNIQGVLGFDKELKNVISIGNSSEASLGKYMVIASNGIMVSNENSDKIGKDSSTLTWIDGLLSSPDGFGEFRIDGVNHMYSKKTDPSNGMSYIMSLEKSKYLLEVIQTMIPFIVIFIVTLIASLFFSNLTSNKIIKPLNSLKKETERINNSLDFSQLNINFNHISELEDIGSSFNLLLYKVVELIDVVKGSSSLLATESNELLSMSKESVQSSEEVSKAIFNVSDATTIQSTELNMAIESLDSLIDSITTASKSANSVAETSYGLNNSAMNGNLALDGLKESYKKLDSGISTVNSVINSLDQFTKEISAVITVIEDVAKKINLLSLNARIESSKAGEAGKGFAVVSEEIRKLSEVTSNATESIRGVVSSAINNIHIMAQESTEMTKSLNETTTNLKNTETQFISITSNSKDLLYTSSEMIENTSKVDILKDTVKEKISKVNEEILNTVAFAQEVSASTEVQLSTLEHIDTKCSSLKTYAEELDIKIKNITTKDS